ncbi:cellulose binding domain-containing protein [Actinophytocola sp. KF-1]
MISYDPLAVGREGTPRDNTGCAATVTAGAAPVNGWTVTTTLPPGATIVHSWEATRGHRDVHELAHNGAIAAAMSVEFGFQGTGTGTGPTPNCTAR